MIAIEGPRPNGGWPVPAYATVAAHECTSDAVVASSPYRISGGEVARRPEQPAGVGELGVVGDPGETEVDQDRGAALEQHVGRLHVAVEHADGVHARHALGEAPREPVQVAAGDRTLLRHVVVQAQTGHVPGRDVRRRGPRVGVDDLGDPAAPDALERADLARQSPPRLVVADDVRPEHLERDPGSVPLASQVDDAHAALAEQREQGVLPHGARARRLDGHALTVPGTSPATRCPEPPGHGQSSTIVVPRLPGTWNE